MGAALRNADYSGDRRELIIDPGPRTLSRPGTRAEFSKDTIPPGYKFGQFPDPPSQGLPITTLGSMLIDRTGRLLVLGGFGRAGGNAAITSFAGADSWHDDISDGSVRCKVKLKNGETVELDAWVIVGSPKFAPELVNIVTLDDLMFDVGVRYLKLAPKMYDAVRWKKSNGWNPAYKASFDRDIRPIIERPGGYQWVANVPAMTAFSMPRFDPRDSGAGSRPARMTYFSYWRKPGNSEVDPSGQQNTFATPWGSPMMPLNAGTNSVTDTLVDKFLTLTETQYFLLGQWAAGKFDTRGSDDLRLDPLDRACVGNAVGSPMCPGIEVTWSTRNPAIYAAPHRIKQAHDETYYAQNGLSPTADECEGGGCEPGDLTKRMAIPWQADFFQCTAQFINFTDPTANTNGTIPKPPTFYAYWWPPQSPMYVMSPIMTAAEQLAAGIPSGFQVYYARGINSFAEMITAWSYLGFISNRNTAASRVEYPSFEEVERNNDRFVTSSVAVGSIDNFSNNTDSYFAPMWFLQSEAAPATPAAATALTRAAGHEAVAEEVARPIVTFGIGRTHRSRR